MKTITSLIFALIIFSLSSKAQFTISPDVNTEVCHSQNYTFTVTIPGTNATVSGTGGASVITNASSTSSTFTFVGKFNDVNQKQVFTVAYKDAGGANQSYPFEFKKVKSLLYNACSLIPSSSIQAPLCQTTDIAYSFTALQWFTEFENSKFCFGSISTYEYLLPSGWKLNNGSQSNGSTWLSGSNSVTFTPDAGTGGVIQVRAFNGCSPASIYYGTSSYISISRPGPTFSLSPTAVQIQCGTSLTQAFTVSMNGTTTCPVNYSWNLGSNNGWLYNGSPASTTPFIAPASITLTSVATPPAIGNVTVTPLLNGSAQPTLTAAASFQAPNFGLVGGSASICTGTSSAFYLYNAPANSSIYWGTTTSLPNYGATVVSVDNQYASSTTLTKINSGVINLTVSATDGCNQTYSRTRENIKVGGYANASDLSGYTLAYPPCYTQGCTPSPVSNPINTQGPYGTTVYSGTAYLNTENHLYIYNTELSGGTWSLISGNPYYWSSSDGNNLTVYPGDSNPIQFRLTANNSCGSLYYDFTFYPYSGYRLFSNTSSYKIFPNPAHGNLTVAVDEEKSKFHKSIKLSDQDIREIVIIDKIGNMKYRQVYNKGIRQMNVNISNLKTGFYLIRIFNGKEWKVLPFTKL